MISDLFILNAAGESTFRYRLKFFVAMCDEIIQFNLCGKVANYRFVKNSNSNLNFNDFTNCTSSVSFL